MSKFPNQIDTDQELPGVIDGATENSGTAINALRDAVLAIENTLGQNPMGSTDSVADRLDVSINSDGSLKSAALSSAGLLSLPITEDQISDFAAIPESKLDLDFPTQDLQDQITSNDVDIANLQAAHTIYSGKYNQHVAGSADKHFASHVVLNATLNGNTNLYNHLLAEDALIKNHIADSADAHDASAISFVPGPDSFLVSVNVQDAIDEIDSSYLSNIESHLDTAHSNGITGTDTLQFGGQAGSRDVCLASTVYTALGGQATLKLGHVNSASVSSKGFNGNLIGPTRTNVTIRFTSGVYLGQIEIVGLHLVPFPDPSSTEITAEATVKELNRQFAAAIAPLTAYCSNGEVHIQHNFLTGSLTIKEPLNNSAVSALGFSEVVDIEISQYDQFKVFVNGKSHAELKTNQSGTAIFASPSSSLTLPVTVAAGSLIHVVAHTEEGVGTYGVLNFSGSVATLSKPIPAGTFSYVIFDDTLSLIGAYSGRLYDVFLSDDMSIVPAVKASASSLFTNTYSLLSASDLIPGQYRLNYMASGSSVLVSLTDSDSNTASSQFTQGFMGEVFVDAPKSGAVVIDVRSIVPNIGDTDIYDVSADSSSDEKLKVCSVWSLGSGGASQTKDARTFGTTSKHDLSNYAQSHLISASSRLATGVVRGSPIIATSTVCYIPEQTILINSKLVTTKATQLSISDFSGIYFVFLDSLGNLRIKPTSSLGFDLVSLYSTNCFLLAKIDTSNWSNPVDLRLLYSLISTDDKLVVGKNIASFDGALAMSDAVPANTIEVSSIDSSSLTIPVGKKVIVLGDVDTGNIVLQSGSNLTVLGNLVSSGFIDATNAEITLAGNSVVPNQRSTLASVKMAVASASFNSFLISGSFDLVGLNADSGLTITSLVNTLEVDSGTDINISNMSLSRANAVLPIVTLTGGTEVTKFEDVSFSQLGSLTFADMSDSSRPAILSQSAGKITILNCHKSNIGPMLSVSTSAVIDDLLISGSSSVDSGPIVFFGSSSVVKNGLIDQFTASGVAGRQVGGLPTSNVRLAVSNCVFSQSYQNTINSNSIVSLTTSGNVTVSNCTVVDLLSDSDLFSVTTGNLHVDSCIIDNCAFGNLFGGEATSVSKAGVFSNNKGYNLSGGLMSGKNKILDRNNLTFVSGGLNSLSTSTPGQYSTYMFDNILTLPSSTVFAATDSIISGNTISAGSFFMGATNIGGGSSGFTVERNSLTSLSGSASIAFQFKGMGIPTSGSKPLCKVSDNNLVGSPAVSLVTLEFTSGSAIGDMIFARNKCLYKAPVSGQSILSVLSNVATTSGCSYEIKGNTFDVAAQSGSSTIATGIVISDGYVDFLDNKINAKLLISKVISGVASKCKDARVSKNTFKSVPVAIDTVAAIDLPLAANNLVFSNYGVRESYSVSPHNSFLSNSANWTTASANGYMLKTVAADAADIAIHAPVGELISVDLDVAVTTAGSVVATLYEIPEVTAAAFATSPIVIGSSTNGFTSKGTITITPAAGYLIRNSASLHLRIACSTSNINLGSVKVIVKQ